MTDAAFEVAVQAWTGDRFEAGEAWRLPRRAGRDGPDGGAASPQAPDQRR